MNMQIGFTAEPTHVPATAQAAASANLIARADRALRDYVAACSTGDEEALARIVTSDAVVEYTLEEPGTYLAVEAAVLSANRWVNTGPIGARAHISKLWIFPTNDSNAVFVHYTIGSDVRSPGRRPDSEHLALLEMRGDRIFRMRNFSADDDNLSRLATSAIDSAHARAHD
jgi:SnoaL-like domain